MAEKQIDVMGFDRFQIAAVKRTHANNKLQRQKADKLIEKIDKMKKELGVINAGLDMWESPIKLMSQKVTGYALTSDEILDMHEDAEKWDAYKQAHDEQPDAPENKEETEEAEPKAEQL